MTATCTAAKDSSSPSFIIIQGEKGWIRIPTTANEFSSVEIMEQGKLTSYQHNAYESRLTHKFIPEFGIKRSSSRSCYHVQTQLEDSS